MVTSLLDAITPMFDDVPTLRVHGARHPGNLLWGRDGGFFLDFDDMVTAPAVQDVWMLVPGRDAEADRQRAVPLDVYQQMRPFDRTTLRLIEPLRAPRYLHYAAWIARRWGDPSFPAATFPQFAERGYWRWSSRGPRERSASWWARARSGRRRRWWRPRVLRA